jgi:hypothetical protein
MTSDARYYPSLRARVSPLFASLYLTDDPDEEEAEGQRTARKRKTEKARVVRRLRAK